MPYCNVDDLRLSPQDSVRRAMEIINQSLRGIVLVLDGERRLLGTLTDGDIRRALLQGISFEAAVSEILAQRPNLGAVTAPVGTEPARMLALMRERRIHQLPLLDADGRVVDLANVDDFLPSSELSLQAVIMAGGAGARLRPLTDNVPKPMLPVGGRPLMELILDRLRDAGIKRVNVATYYRSEQIVEHFGDGAGFGVELRYVSERQPLGTAGALGLIDAPGETLLVINGDILTNVDFRAMLRYHREHDAALTLATRRYEIKVPYGVVEQEGSYVRRVVEKPSVGLFVNAGIYLLEPHVLTRVPTHEASDMTDLIRQLIDAGETVVSFPLIEYWLDIGQPTDYERAQEDVKQRRTGA